ncbi:HigA family addiction module antitoxin [Salinibacter ruber]|uniref:HigA family addiction module antitoxin n=1 Tax=Salinibacter ruber TaxID=146919 RepID=UPI0021690ECD|nr:HigA family addiction module antitoxin [Salinibacter ruber]MCS4101378.1 addiction module HigA family antidote [Salinibacter ruber]
MPMKSPPHPGEIVRKDCIEPLDLTITEAAEGLGVSRKHLSALVNGRAGTSPEMAICLSWALGGSPEGWLTGQMQYDLRQAEEKSDPEVKRFAAAQALLTHDR